MRLILCERKQLNIDFHIYPKFYAGILFHEFHRNTCRTDGNRAVQKKAKTGNKPYVDVDSFYIVLGIPQLLLDNN